jgi:hypothetical protein
MRKVLYCTIQCRRSSTNNIHIRPTLHARQSERNVGYSWNSSIQTRFSLRIVGCRQTIWETESTRGGTCTFVSEDEGGWVGADGTDASVDDETESAEVGCKERAGGESPVWGRTRQTKRGAETMGESRECVLRCTEMWDLDSRMHQRGKGTIEVIGRKGRDL